MGYKPSKVVELLKNTYNVEITRLTVYNMMSKYRKSKSVSAEKKPVRQRRVTMERQLHR